LWTSSNISWAFVFGTRMRMMELEVDINFTSPYIGDETFFKRTMVSTLLANIPTNYL
jgi:hypothetical protein